MASSVRMREAMAENYSMLRLIAVALAAAVLIVAGPADVGAQTLTAPDSPSKSSPPPSGAKSQPAKRLEACSTFGPGFVKVPGTNACIKIGGGATVEATGHGR